MSFYKLYQCPLGLMPHCYVMHQQSSSSVVINVSMPSRASTSLLRATVLCQSSWGYTCQCPLGLVPHCYVRSAVVHSVNKDGVSMPSRASTSLLLFRSVKDLRVINSYVSMPSRASTSLLPAILGNIGRMTSLCQCPLGLVPHCYSTPSKTQVLCGFQSLFLQVFVRIF